VAKYLIETNLTVSRANSGRECSDEDLSCLLSFADWLIVLQEDADVCFHMRVSFSDFFGMPCVLQKYRRVTGCTVRGKSTASSEAPDYIYHTGKPGRMQGTELTNFRTILLR